MQSAKSTRMSYYNWSGFAARTPTFVSVGSNPQSSVHHNISLCDASSRHTKGAFWNAYFCFAQNVLMTLQRIYQQSGSRFKGARWWQSYTSQLHATACTLRGQLQQYKWKHAIWNTPSVVFSQCCVEEHYKVRYGGTVRLSYCAGWVQAHKHDGSKWSGWKNKRTPFELLPSGWTVRASRCRKEPLLVLLPPHVATEATFLQEIGRRS